MARPRYGAAKRAREIRKQEERARKLARKHGRAAARAAAGPEPESAGSDASAAEQDGTPETGPPERAPSDLLTPS